MKGRRIAWIVASLLVVGAILWALLPWIQLSGKTRNSLHIAKSIGLACKLYASDHGGQYPERLEKLVPEYLPDGRWLRCPFAPGLTVGWDYFGGKDTDPPGKVLLRSKEREPGGRFVIVRSDQSAEISRIPQNRSAAPTQNGIGETP